MPFKILRNFTPQQLDTKASAALLLVRFSVGVVFLQTGWGKLHNLSDIIEFFKSLGIPAAEIQAPFVSGLEFVGGVALCIGLLSRLFSLPLIGTMVVAIITAKFSEIESATDVLSFIEWHYLVSFAVIALVGPGKFSLDHWLLSRIQSFRPQPSTSSNVALQM